MYLLFENVSQTTENNSNINLKKLNETQINNATLCISNCIDVTSKTSDKLALNLSNTNIIMDLLYMTRDGRNSDMQKNCGILIAKLCKKNEK